MTRLSPSQVVHLLPKPVVIEDTVGGADIHLGPSQSLWGSYGGTSHRWYWKANRDSWFTVCERPRYQTQKEPDGNSANRCKQCEEVSNEHD